jgi:hypothetical protein
MTQTALTREQVLALKPGNELDLIVAIEVMGHEAGEFKDGWIKLGPKFEGCPKRYSTDISAAWEVFKWLVKMHEDATIAYPWNVSADYDPMRETTWKIHAEGKSVPEAICKAALLAVLDI